MIDPIQVAVFCGFRGQKVDPTSRSPETSEKDFVYMLLEIFATGRLRPKSSKPGAGESITSEGPHHGMFHLIREFGEGSPVRASAKLIQESDVAMVILPRRQLRGEEQEDFDTSVYALMEYAFACGTGIPVLMIAEEGIDATRLGFATELHRWWSDIDREAIKEPQRWPNLYRDFRSVVQDFLLRKPFTVGLPDYRTDAFYREKLIPLVLNWHEVSIYNHSILPLSSSFCPAGESINSESDWVTFNKVQEHHLVQPHRGLYFEVEETLLTGSRTRLDSFIEAVPSDTFDSHCLDRINERVQLKPPVSQFNLIRFASLVPYDAYTAFPSENDRRKSLARNLSVLLQAFRLNRWQAERNRINYQLFGIKTYYPYSMPTTIYAERERLNGKANKIAGVWGFLRSSGSETRDGDDAFIIGQNSDSVKVWRKHIDAINATTGHDMPVPLFVPGSGAQFEEFFQLVGPEMRDLLKEEIVTRGWTDVLKITGI